MKFWAAQFQRGHKSLGDDERFGHLVAVTTDENIIIVHQMVLNDRQIKVREIAEAMKMSKRCVCHI